MFNVEVIVMSRLLQAITKSVTIFIGPCHILGQLVTIISCNISDLSHYRFNWLQYCHPGVCLHLNCNRFSNLPGQLPFKKFLPEANTLNTRPVTVPDNLLEAKRKIHLTSSYPRATTVCRHTFQAQKKFSSPKKLS